MSPYLYKETFADKVKYKFKKRFVKGKSRLLKYWTKIPKEFREQFWIFLSEVINYLWNGVLLAIPISILTEYPYIKCVICVTVVLAFIEHYWIWFWEHKRTD